MDSIFTETYSLKIAFDNLSKLDYDTANFNDLGFIATCMRDNVPEQTYSDSEDLYKLLDLVVHVLLK